MTVITPSDVLNADLNDWALLAGKLRARFITENFAAGTAFVAQVTQLAEASNHHPDVTLTYPFVELTLISHDENGVTERDLDLARQISSLAADQGVDSATVELVDVKIGLDTADRATLAEFWAVALDGAVVDGRVVGSHPSIPVLWFQPSEPHSAPRQRFHFDIWIDQGTLDDRIAAALAAGGTVVSDERRPAFVVIADPDGNRACFCTSLGR